jgi:3-deoxy-manno-octulosonate cytidylyltransferase (CMP-KDO synthetase)
MKTLIVIPARYASSRFPAKPLAQIAGPDGVKTLVQRAWEAGLAAGQMIGAQVVVATDDARIAAHVQGFGGQVVMTSAQAQNGTERCAEVASKMGGYDLIVNLQGDAPLTPPWFIAELVAAIAQGDADVATPVLRCDGAMRAALITDRRAGRVGGTTAVFAPDGAALYFSKEVIPYCAQAFQGTDPTPVFHHVGLYAYRTGVLRDYPHWPSGALEALEGLEQLRFLEQGRRVLCVQVAANSRQFWEVNNPEDIPIVEAMIAHNVGLA